MEFEATVPQGIAPGQVFMAQTPIGQVPVQVPPGGVPGQKIRFAAPNSSHASAPQPVLLGTATPYQVPMGTPVQQPGSAYVPGQVCRVDPWSANLDNVPLLQGIPVEKRERKVYEIRKGAELARDQGMFPERRRCVDAFWALPFLAVLAGMIVATVYFSQRLKDDFNKAMEGRTTSAAPSSVYDDVDVGELIAPGIMGGAAALVGAAFYVALVRYAPGCMVWTSLLLSPTLTIMAGLALLGSGNMILGLLVIALGLVFLTCVFWCWRPFIPFTIVLVRTVADVIKSKPMMVLVGLLGSLAGMGWSLICGIVFIGAYYAFEDDLENASGGQKYGIMFAAALIFVWGAQVAQNICHVTYCGVFGRWYFQLLHDKPLRKSLGVALTTSFGSICFGSLLIAAIRALEFVVRSARREAQEDGNPVLCVVLCVLEAIISCIGDILEYFSDWAYVQCAVRGTSFMDSARITYAMMTCSNMTYVLSDLLINSVVSMGALLCGVIGGAAGALIGLAFANGSAALAGGVIGLFAGVMAGGAAAGIISSGTKTILALWAENPEPLFHTHPEIHQEFERKICGQLYA